MGDAQAMLTIQFDDADHQTPAPYFLLNEAGGRSISARDFYEESSVLLCFLHAPDCNACREFLETVASRLEDYRWAGAQVLAIYPASAETLRSKLDWVNRGILLLADPENVIRRQYASLMAPGLIADRAIMFFVLDAYFAPYACLTGLEPEASAREEIENWLQYISIQCPE